MQAEVPQTMENRESHFGGIKTFNKKKTPGRPRKDSRPMTQVDNRNSSPLVPASSARLGMKYNK